MKSVLIMFSSLIIMNQAVAADKILRLKSDPWCPFNCEDKAKNLGIVVDIAKTILEKKGYKVDYQNVNFARALKETRSGENDGIAGCGKEDAPDFIFPEVPQTETTYNYFALSESKFNYKNISSVAGHKIGVINSYSYDKETTDEIQKKNPSFVVVSGDAGLAQLIKMLDSKHIDAIVESGAVFSNYLIDKKIDIKKYKFVGAPVQEPQQLFICLSPKLAKSKEIAKLITDGMKELKKSGELNKIIQKYNLKEWKK